MVFITWPYLERTKRLLLPVIFLGVFNYLDFQLPAFSHYFQPKTNDNYSIKIIQANIGGGGSLHEIQLLVKNEQPDILLLQEARHSNISKWFSLEYRTSCKSGLCIVSKLDFEEVGALHRDLIEGWGNFALLYKIKTTKGDFSLANIHMETPRAVLMSVINRQWDQSSAIKTDENRAFQALMISAWVKAQQEVIIAGDFNMLEDENIYNEFFSSWGNAIGNAGFGLNYTKKTAWHGVRIDHLLYSDGFVLKSAMLSDFLMGDHQPVISIIGFSRGDKLD